MSFDIYGRNPVVRSDKPNAPDYSGVRSDVISANEYYKLLDDWYTDNPGYYFSSNWWRWRPIIELCKRVSDSEGLDIDFNCWDVNGVDGLEDGDDCRLLADGLRKVLGDNSLWSADGHIYLVSGMWVDTDRRAVSLEINEKLNTMFDHGILMSGGIEMDGRMYYSAHACSSEHLERFIAFLYECGGFNIR